MADIEAHGPIDFVLLEFSDDGPLDGPAAALLELVEAGIVRLYDLAVLRKAADSSFEALEIGPDTRFAQFAGARSGLLSEDDFVVAADAMAPGTVATLIVYENAWAIPFVSAARRAGGEMIATTRIPAQDVMDVLDELESAG